MENEIMKSEVSYNQDQKNLVKEMFAKNSTDDELKLLMYMSEKYQLDILTRKIWLVKFNNQPAQIYAGRDGFLEIAHRSGQFNGMESGTKIVDNKLKGWAIVYRKDMQFPFKVEVDLEEYTTNLALWKSKPKTMLQKVAESQALRKAFSISGFYEPSEMSQYELDSQNITYKTSTPPEVLPPAPAITTATTTSTTPKPTGTFDWSKVKLDNKIEFKAGTNKDGTIRLDKKGKQVPYNGIWYHTLKEVREALPAINTEELVKEFIGKKSYTEFTYGDLKMIQEQIPAFIEKFNNAEAVDPEVLEAEVEDTDAKMKDTFGVAPTAPVETEQALFSNEEASEWMK